MYNVLVHKDVFNVLAVVVRYWGGMKLGAGGLTRAYGQAISEAVKTAELIPVEPMCERRYALQFADESTFRRYCEQQGVTVIDAQYGDAVTLRLKMKSARSKNSNRPHLICCAARSKIAASSKQTKSVGDTNSCLLYTSPSPRDS